MAKFLVLLVMCFFVQFSYAINEMEAFNTEIRVQLNIYDKLQNEPDSVNYIDDLNKLVKLTESALKAKSINEKGQILSAATTNLSPEFDSWLSRKVEETEMDGYIQNNIEFYHSLLQDHAEYEADIKEIMRSLENLLKTNLEYKKKMFSAFPEAFSADFQNFVAGELKAKAIFVKKRGY